MYSSPNSSRGPVASSSWCSTTECSYRRCPEPTGVLIPRTRIRPSRRLQMLRLPVGHQSLSHEWQERWQWHTTDALCRCLCETTGIFLASLPRRRCCVECQRGFDATPGRPARHNWSKQRNTTATFKSRPCSCVYDSVECSASICRSWDEPTSATCWPCSDRCIRFPAVIRHPPPPRAGCVAPA